MDLRDAVHAGSPKRGIQIMLGQQLTAHHALINYAVLNQMPRFAIDQRFEPSTLERQP